MVELVLKMSIPEGKHSDWPWPFSLLPRGFLAWYGASPRQIAGNTKDLKPIPDQGNWIVTWPLYFASQSKSGWHFRIGARWDDVDFYYQLSFKIGKYNYD